MPRIICGIGSRDTPNSILQEMVKVGDFCRQNQIWVRSGHAPGADQAFEKGAQEYCIAYLPWPTFEEKQHGLGGRYKTPENWANLMIHAAQFHPAWENLSPAAKKLIARNSAQVLGLELNSPVQAVVCWTKNGEEIGGTSQTIRIAKKNNIPIFNMWDYPIFSYVRSELKELFKLNS